MYIRIVAGSCSGDTLDAKQGERREAVGASSYQVAVGAEKRKARSRTPWILKRFSFVQASVREARTTEAEGGRQRSKKLWIWILAS